MVSLIMIVLGVFIGWNFPQPEYAKKVQDAVMAKLRAMFTR